MNSTPFLQAYGLDALLTAQDDPQLWEAALRLHWPAPADPACGVDVLRFHTGRRLAEGEQPQGEANERHAGMRGMVDVTEWCFERVDETHLRIRSCPPQTTPAPVPYLGQGLAAVLSGQAAFAPAQVFMFLGISRPSRGAGQAVVYTASSAPGAGEGSAYLWRCGADGCWQPTDQRLAWGIT